MKNRLSNELEDDIEEFEQEELMKLMGKKTKTISRSITQTEHIYPLTYTIETFNQSEELFRLLLTANAGDVVRIYISTIGGSLEVSERIVACIAEAQSRGVTVIGDLGLNCASGGSMIALACSDLIVSPNLQFMIHNWASGGGYGHPSNILSEAEFNKKMAIKWVRNTYENFLTEEEILSIIENPRDLNFSAEEVIERWGKMQEALVESEGDGKVLLDDLIALKVNSILDAREKAAKAPVKKVVTKKAPKKKV